MLTWLAVLASRVRGLLMGRRLDEEFDHELAAHLDMLTDEHIGRGMPPDEARRQAILRLGGPMPIREQQHDDRGLPFVDTTLHDVRHAVRSLRRNPGFAAVAVLTLAVGITATTSMFTVARAVLLRPLPYAKPERLVEISEVNPLKGWTHTVVAPANLANWRARNTVFTDIAAYIGVDDHGASEYQVFLSSAGETQPLKGIAVMGNLFDVLAVGPLLARTFTFDETFEGKDQVVVLAHGTWQTVFGGDPHIVGRSIVLSGRSTTVIGVMPRDFFFPNRSAQFWTPLGVKPDVFTSMRRPHWMNTVARLRPGVSLAQAREQMTTIAAELERIKFGRPLEDDPWMTIVGVVADEKQDRMDQPASPEAYVPMRQNSQNPMTFVVRSANGIDAAVDATRRELRAVDKDLALTDVAPLTDVIEESIGDERFRTLLLAAFAGVALFLAALGIYGVLAYVVSQRSRELGIRLALGAKPQELFTMVVRQGMRPVIAGVAGGLACAIALTTLMESLLFGVHAADPTTYAVTLSTLAVIALAACAMPALRASRVHPLAALREE